MFMQMMYADPYRVVSEYTEFLEGDERGLEPDSDIITKGFAN